MELSLAQLKNLLEYDPNTGVFTWRQNRGGTAKAGSIAGHIFKDDGHTVIRVNYVIYQARRLAWLYIYGAWPKTELVHINGDRSDNCIKNLRESTRAEIVQNISVPSHNTSGIMGVSWCKGTNKWRATIKVQNVCISLGRFNTPEEASEAYQKAKKELHKIGD